MKNQNQKNGNTNTNLNNAILVQEILARQTQILVGLEKLDLVLANQIRLERLLTSAAGASAASSAGKTAQSSVIDSGSAPNA